jgi:tRNA (mo5U34)-methyltransferase
MVDVSSEPALAGQVAALKWYHKMDLNGVITPGVSETSRGLPRLALPESLAGQSVLDVGAWDGFYSFEAARRGASRVLATDSFAWDGSCWGSQDGFRLARRVLGLEGRVDATTIDVMDLSPEVLGETFDVTLFLGVLYHLKDPISAIERVASVTRGLLVLETETALNWLPQPAARVFVGTELADDDTNVFALNQPSLIGLLRRQGFVRTEVKYRTSLVRRVGRGLAAIGSRRSFAPVFRSARIVIHARRSPK